MCVLLPSCYQNTTAWLDFRVGLQKAFHLAPALNKKTSGYVTISKGPVCGNSYSRQKVPVPL